jgi:DegV family protein with EDD domain
MIRVVTDSSSDLPVDVATHHRVEVVPLTVRFGDDEYLDREELAPPDFWEKLHRSGSLPETAAPTVGQFQDAYSRLADEGAAGIVAVCLSSRLSATYEAASIAAERMHHDLPVEVVDSQAVTLALGFQVLEAARAAREGRDLDDVARAARAATPRTNVIATVGTLEFLKRGRRIGVAQALVGGLLDVTPLITLDKGVVAPAGRVRTRSKALAIVADRVGELAPHLAEIAVVHGLADDIEALIIHLEPHVAREDILIADLGPVVGTHTGPGVIGVAYRLK